MFKSYQQAKELYTKYERFLIPGFLFAGFILDLFTFKTLQIQTALVLLAMHICICAIAITVLTKAQVYQDKKHPMLLRYAVLVAPFFMQLSFGALLSAAFIFYSFSGVISISWPLMGIFLLLIILNEVYKQAYLDTRIQLLVLTIVLFSTLSIALPFILKSISPFVYFLSLMLSGVCMYGFFIFLKWINGEIFFIFPFLKNVFIGLVWIASILYVANLVPPIPLTVRDSGVYHELNRIGSAYQVLEQKENIVQRLVPGKTIQIEKGKPLYVFTSIFAPNDLNTAIVHHWQWKNPETKKWNTMSTPSFSLSGGRQDGYRGYSVVTNLKEGKWRIYVETPRGQKMGKVNFEVEFIDSQENSIEYIEKSL